MHPFLLFLVRLSFLSPSTTQKTQPKSRWVFVPSSPPPPPSLCKLFLIALGKTRHREVEMKIRCVPSVWLSVTPHLENPGYAFVTVSKLNNCVPSSHHKGSLFKEWYRIESKKIKQQQRKRISTSCNVTKATLIKITIHLHLVEWYRTGKRYFCQE